MLRKLTIKNIKREVLLLENSKMKAQQKFNAIIGNADEELAEWIFVHNINSWKQLVDKVNETKNENKEDMVIELLKTPRIVTEDAMEYCNKIITKAKQAGLKETSIIALLSNNLWSNSSFKLEINNSTSIEDALYRIATIVNKLKTTKKFKPKKNTNTFKDKQSQ